MRARAAVMATAALLVLLPTAPAIAATSAPQAPTARRYPIVDCVPYLPADTIYNAIFRDYQTDGLGRPDLATAANLTRGNSPRTPCETTVGGWGPPGYQGGHLIAATLRGVSQRYNLVPMQGTQINQGLMKAIENGAKKCLDVAAVTNYTVSLHYPVGPSVVPDRITVSMTPQAIQPPIPFNISFPNTTLTRRHYTRLKNRISAQFIADGC